MTNHNSFADVALEKLASRPGLALTFGSAIACVTLALSAADAQGADREQRELARNYVAAIRSQDPSRVEALWHPASRACLTQTDRSVVARILANQLHDGLHIGANYEIRRVEPVGYNTNENLLLPSRYFRFPVSPALIMEIGGRTVTKTAVSIVTIVLYLAPANGSWFIDMPCPTSEGVQALTRK